VSDRRPLVITCVIIAVGIVCIVCLVAVGGGAALLRQYLAETDFDGLTVDLFGTSTPTPQIVRPTPGSTEDIATPDPLAGETLQLMKDVIVPINDPVDLARRLLGVQQVPGTLEPPAAPYQVGAQDDFWMLNSDENTFFRFSATLRYVTEHAYFWIQDEVSYDEDALRELADTFEEHIYPTDRAFFGSEWSPGIDGDPHIYIFYVGDIGYNVAGFFISNDSVHPLASQYSNGHETFAFNADNVSLDEPYAYAVLAHEFQHMIHWYQDRNETSWLNEGMSELAILLNGFDPGGFDYVYTLNPDLQLNDWENIPDGNTAHYGASFLFTTYLLDRLGDEVTQAVVAHPENGLTSIDDVFASLAVTDPLTGQPITADDLILDWTIANFLQDRSLSDGRFGYSNYPDAPSTYTTESIYDCDTSLETRSVHQYGVDYIKIACSGQPTLHFEGSTTVDLIPAEPHSGDYAFWSNKGDESDMTLTQHFDFSDHSGALTLSYWTWYDIETDYDYVYLEASLDGETWEILTTPSGTPEDPSGNSYGWGYNDLSGGGPVWIQETVDLTRFAGQEVYLRFEYITDAAVNGEGFLLDDVAIPEVGYFTDFEADSGGWEAAGFVRTATHLPQNFRLALISFSDQITIEYLDLLPDNSLDIPLDFESDIDDVVLVVMGTTRFTRQQTAYRFSFTP